MRAVSNVSKSPVTPGRRPGLRHADGEPTWGWGTSERPERNERPSPRVSGRSDRQVFSQRRHGDRASWSSLVRAPGNVAEPMPGWQKRKGRRLTARPAATDDGADGFVSGARQPLISMPQPRRARFPVCQAGERRARWPKQANQPSDDDFRQRADAHQGEDGDNDGHPEKPDADVPQQRHHQRNRQDIGEQVHRCQQAAGHDALAARQTAHQATLNASCRL